MAANVDFYGFLPAKMDQEVIMSRTNSISHRKKRTRIAMLSIDHWNFFVAIKGREDTVNEWKVATHDHILTSGLGVLLALNMGLYPGK